MQKFKQYCKGYLLKDLRNFSHWHELNNNARALTIEEGGDNVTPRKLDENSIVYLHQNYNVCDNILSTKNIIFSSVDDSWKVFCKEILRFDAGL